MAAAAADAVSTLTLVARADRRMKNVAAHGRIGSNR
jgi:hypothetical protein